MEELMVLRFLGKHEWVMPADDNLTHDYHFHAGNKYEQDVEVEDAGFLLSHYPDQFAVVEPEAPAKHK
jgi:calcineurin-like phosphoesterase family protein